MAANAQVYTNTTIVDAAPSTDTETIVASVGPVASNSYGSNVKILFNLGITPGADTSAVVVKCYRNAIGGTQIGATQTIGVTAAQASNIFAAFIANEPVGNATYVVAITCTSASANATVSRVAIVAIVGN